MLKREKPYTVPFKNLKDCEWAFREIEGKLRLMFESVSEGIVVTDLNGVIIDVNNRVVEILGFGSIEDVVGRSVFEYIAPHDHEKAAADMQTTLEREEFRPLEYTYLRADGSEFPGEISAGIIKDNSNKPIGFIVIARDITERKRWEQEREELWKQAHIDSRLTTVSEMAAGIAHEINNPLTGVIGYAQMLLRKELPEDIKKKMAIIYESGERVTSIVNKMLTFAHHYKPERTPVNINALIETTLEMRSIAMKTNNINVTTQLKLELPQITADGGQLQQAFLNIILNAETEMKLAHGKGNFSIKTERSNNTIRISFTDDGMGIAKENLERVFDPFFTTREVGQGKGLGLSMSHGIISLHDGKIYARSIFGKGATFIVELPIINLVPPKKGGRS